MRREDAMLLGVGMALLAVAGVGLPALQRYLGGDWAEIADCRETFWTCRTEASGRPRVVRTEPALFSAEARSCAEYRAYEVSVRRAIFDCSMDRSIVGGTCREVDTKCALPDRAY